MQLKLQTVLNEGLAAFGAYGAAAVLLTIPAGARPWGKCVVRHTGTAGFWYGSFSGLALTTVSYSFKIGPGEPFPLDNMPIGDLKLLAGAGVNGDLSYAVGWAV